MHAFEQSKVTSLAKIESDIAMNGVSELNA